MSSSSPASAKTKRLADLFRPPFDIMYHGEFEEARETAKEKNKWLMINIQNQTEFACQVMNRDLWSDSFVKDIIRESFIFLQVK
jgi:thioredoxin-related protein